MSGLWEVYCVEESGFIQTTSVAEPTVCPTNPAHTIRAVHLISSGATSTGYVVLSSSLADDRAIRIDASGGTGFGGIDVDAGSGGIAVDTTNTFQVNAGAQSGISTSAGNVVLDSAGNVVINSTNGGAGGVTIADNATAQTVNLGTGAAAKTVNVGNSTGATTVTLTTGTGNLTLTGNGTTAGAVTIAATQEGGGIDVDAGTGGARVDSTGQIVVSSTRASGNDVLIDAPNGSVSLASGALGWIGSTTGTMFLRHSLFSCLVQSQPVETTLADADATLTTAQLLTKILSGAPSVNRTVTSPTAALCVSGLGGAAVADSVDFSVISTGAADFILGAGTGVTLNGSGTVSSGSSGRFRLAYRNVTALSEAVTIYRLA